MNRPLISAGLAECSIAVKCADDPLLERCLDSIDDPTVAVNAVITPSKRIEALLNDRDIPYVTTEHGNIAKSAQISVEEAEHDNVIVMDSDAYFAPGAISRLRVALSSAVVAKPRLEFHDRGTRISRAIAGNRRSYNASPDRATNPGLAIRRKELAERCGYIFNPLIRWTEDMDLNHRMKVNDVPIAYVPEAVVFHDPISLRHELHSAFLYGIGKRLSIEHTPGRESSEELSIVLGGLVKNNMLKTVRDSLAERGIDGTLLEVTWQSLYLAGYHSQKRLGCWTVDHQPAE